MIKLIYKDVDITDSVDVLRCTHEMYATGYADSLMLTVDDSNNLWDKWKPQKGDVISVVAGDVKSGNMYLKDTYQENARYTLHASALPLSAKRLRDKAWQKVRFLQIGEKIAQNHGLVFKHYGVNDVIIDYNLQKGEHDFSFLSRLCILEGCAFLIYDETLVIYSENALESAETQDTIELLEDSVFRLTDRSETLCGICRLVRGEYAGSFQCANGREEVYIPGSDIRFSLSSNIEAARFAKNLLRFRNKSAYTGYIRFNEIMKYIPGSVYDLKCERISSWNGPVFITGVRNDYVKDKSKVFFRRTLGGEY